MNNDMLWIVLLTLAAGPAVAADTRADGSSYSQRVQQTDGSGPAANAEASMQRGAKKAGHAVQRGAKKTGQAVGKGLESTGSAVDRAGEKLEQKSR